MTSGREHHVSFRADDDLIAELHARGERAGPTARRDLARYYQLLRASLSTISLTPGEALLLVDATTALLLTYAGQEAASMPLSQLSATLAEALRDGTLAARHAISDPDDLLHRVRALGPVSGLALVDALERYIHATSVDRRAAPDPGVLLMQVGLLAQ